LFTALTAAGPSCRAVPPEAAAADALGRSHPLRLMRIGSLAAVTPQPEPFRTWDVKNRSRLTEY
jgi:hypothetical protein